MTCGADRCPSGDPDSGPRAYQVPGHSPWSVAAACGCTRAAGNEGGEGMTGEGEWRGRTEEAVGRKAGGRAGGRASGRAGGRQYAGWAGRKLATDQRQGAKRREAGAWGRRSEGRRPRATVRARGVREVLRGHGRGARCRGTWGRSLAARRAWTRTTRSAAVLHAQRAQLRAAQHEAGQGGARQLKAGRRGAGRRNAGPRAVGRGASPRRNCAPLSFSWPCARACATASPAFARAPASSPRQGAAAGIAGGRTLDGPRQSAALLRAALRSIAPNPRQSGAQGTSAALPLSTNTGTERAGKGRPARQPPAHTLVHGMEPHGMCAGRMTGSPAVV